MTIRADATSLYINYGGRSVPPRRVANGTTSLLVRTRNGVSYERAGPSATTINVTGDEVPYQLWRCR